ncbi:MAG: HipA-like protein [Paucimonas sp.]|nr:HipA-like protein [Paucimonas sp.]
MDKQCTVQLFCDGSWHDVASVLFLGPPAAGWKAATYIGYTADWAVAHAGARDARALACGMPVGLNPVELRHWPVVLIDMLPQGYGRGELLRQLGMSEAMEEAADWPLLVHGAGNPIGNLRIKEAAEWLGRQARPQRGFTDDEVALRSDDFMEYLAQFGLFVAGSSGVQGEWPKVLLTRARDGLLYLDHALPDEEATQHFIVKFGRGANAGLATILRNEAPYMALAKLLGLRVHGELHLKARALFIPRFDRLATKAGVVRLAQESVAALTQRPGFGVVPSHDEVCRQLARNCTDPLLEIAEYLRRDVANLALGNKDNHARNTALQRDFDGRIALAPVFDFAPMYLHPDGIARRIRWENNDGGAPDWGRVLDSVSEQCGLPRQALCQQLQAMVAPLREIAQRGLELGLEPEVHAFVRPGVLAQAQALENLA